ncbi:MAG: proteasome accessory factor PafA2 family protein, partial [Actinomycetota bacterium]|nr:proteasome accessory factor PafA2 family protein [Actinomycetota bacterium]
KYAESHGLDMVGGDEVGNDVLDRWEHMLTALESEPMSLADQVDWIAKRRLYEGFRERHDLEWGDPKLAALDLQYHDLRPGKSLARRIGLQRITDDAEVEHAIDQPPPTTRAYFRGRCLDKYPDQIVAANWDSMVFDVGGDPLRRVPMLEPLRGTEAHVGSLLDDCDDAAELLRRLGS